MRFDSISRCYDLIEKMREDSIIPENEFCGEMAKELATIRQKELDQIIEIYKQLINVLQED